MPGGFTPKKPDYIVSALLKQDNVRGVVGAAWIGANGSIRIKLNSFVVLTGSEDLVITLFKSDNKQAVGSKSKTGFKDEYVPF